MQITLNQDEIIQAIIAHVKSCINVAEGTEITVDLRAGRGDNGFSATLDIVPIKSAVTQIPNAYASTLAVAGQSMGNAKVTEAAPEKAAEPAPVAVKKAGGLFGAKPTAIVPEAAPEVAETPSEDDVMGQTFNEEDEVPTADPDATPEDDAPAPKVGKSIFARSA